MECNLYTFVIFGSSRSLRRCTLYNLYLISLTGLVFHFRRPLISAKQIWHESVILREKAACIKAPYRHYRMQSLILPCCTRSSLLFKSSAWPFFLLSSLFNSTVTPSPWRVFKASFATFDPRSGTIVLLSSSSWETDFILNSYASGLR